MSFVRLVSDTTQNGKLRPDLLLQYLIGIQHKYQHIPEKAIKQLSQQLERSEADIKGVIGFYSFLHRQSRGSYDIQISDNITDRMQGNRTQLNRLCKKLDIEPGTPRPDGRVTVSTTACTGMSDQGPAMLVNGRVIPRLNVEKIDAVTDLIESAIPLNQWPEALFCVNNNIRRRDLLLSDQSTNSDALRALRERGAIALLEQIRQSGLRGRGGAGFYTGIKWQLCQQSRAEQRYVVCNADEGEPGTFKDRVLLSTQADKIIEGMTLCAGIIGASKGFIYLRGEYRYLLASLELCLKTRRNTGLLGTSILGKPGFDFDIEIHLGAGAYVCGEESALIESLEGKRGIPRNRPPFPVSHGYMDQPTVVNNVETFFAATLIATHGAEWFNAVGTEKSSGTKLLSISGDCTQPGIYEYPFGTTIQTILDDCGATNTQAVQVSGAAGMTLAPQEFNRCIAFEDIPCGGSFMIFNQQRALLDMTRNFAHFFVHESCGFCTPCRVGGALLKELIDKLHASHAGPYDVREIKTIGALMQNTSHCGLGASAANSILDVLAKFPAAYQSRLSKSDHEPAFNLDAALQEARVLSGRQDAGAHISPETQTQHEQ